IKGIKKSYPSELRGHLSADDYYNRIRRFNALHIAQRNKIYACNVWVGVLGSDDDYIQYFRAVYQTAQIEDKGNHIVNDTDSLEAESAVLIATFNTEDSDRNIVWKKVEITGERHNKDYLIIEISRRNTTPEIMVSCPPSYDDTAR
ncbi:5332_t:CDS:2, partial [Paraglomus occultum]